MDNAVILNQEKISPGEMGRRDIFYSPNHRSRISNSNFTSGFNVSHQLLLTTNNATFLFLSYFSLISIRVEKAPILYLF